MIAVLLVQLAGILLVEGMRFGAGSRHLAPWPASANLWAMSTGVLAGLAFLWLRRRGVARKRLGWRLPVIWLVWGVTPIAVWVVGDLVIERGAELWWIVGAALVAAMALFVERREWWGSVLSGRRAATAWGAAVLAVGVAFALVLRSMGEQPPPATRASEWWLALTTYPLYALGQLLVYLVLPRIFLHREGFPDRVLIVVSGTSFALAHWPNPLLTPLTGVAMAVWAGLYLRGASLLSLALAMGWLGAVFAQGVSPESTGYMRVGPGYVLRMQQVDHLATFDARVRFLASDESFRGAGGELQGWLRWLHREVFGAEITDADLEGWARRIRREVRSRVLRTVYESAEFAALHGPQPHLYGRDRRLLFPHFQPRGPAQAGYEELRSDATFSRLGNDFRAFLALVYRELLQREASSKELGGWPADPFVTEREEIVRMFLRAGPERDFYIFESADHPVWWPTGAN